YRGEVQLPLRPGHCGESYPVRHCHGAARRCPACGARGAARHRRSHQRVRVLDSTDCKLLALLLVASGWLFVYFDRLNNPNELVRVYMARALAEHGTYAIGMRERRSGGFRDTGPVYDQWGYVNEKALGCDEPGARPPDCAGRLYAAKAPGPSFLAVPVLAALKLLLRREPTRTEDVFALRWMLCIVPTALFWIAMRRFLLRS